MRATSTSSHKKVGCLIVFLALMAAALLPLHNPLRTEIKNLYCDRRCGLLSEVREWEQRFGKPQELADENLEGFIYWPKDGMAALAGYLYEAQGRSVKNLSDRKVTSILIPCKRRVPLSSFDIYIEGHLEFSSTPADKVSVYRPLPLGGHDPATGDMLRGDLFSVTACSKILPACLLTMRFFKRTLSSAA